jgi:hypothetical protein
MGDTYKEGNNLLALSGDQHIVRQHIVSMEHCLNAKVTKNKVASTEGVSRYAGTSAYEQPTRTEHFIDCASFTVYRFVSQDAGL